jgi:hypothetical protein
VLDFVLTGGTYRAADPRPTSAEEVRSVSGAPEPRWWRRRRDLAWNAALQAQAEAAVALVHLDTAQRSAASHLEFIAGVDAGPTAARLRAAWRPVDEVTDSAIRDYLSTDASFDLVHDPELEHADAAAAAYASSTAAMTAAAAQIDAFTERFHADFVRVTSTLESLAARRRTTEQALEQASAAIEGAEAQGLRCHRPRALLVQALERFRVVEQGPASAGMSAVLQACQDAVALAAEVTAAVQALPALRERVRRRTLSLATRSQALAWRVTQGDEQVMSALRRDFVLGCSEDLEGSGDRARAALHRAEQATADAAAAADERRWEDALGELARVAEELDEAQRHAEEPRARLRLLRAVAADPRAAAGRARFALRDARHLLMAGPVDPRHGRTLDQLAARLEQAEDLLRDRPHPDWLHYAHLLDAIVDGARGLVVDIRASRVR